MIFLSVRFHRFGEGWIFYFFIEFFFCCDEEKTETEMRWQKLSGEWIFAVFNYHSWGILQTLPIEEVIESKNICIISYYVWINSLIIYDLRVKWTIIYENFSSYYDALIQRSFWLMGNILFKLLIWLSLPVDLWLF